MKKIISIALSISMLLSFNAFSSYAENTETILNVYDHAEWTLPDGVSTMQIADASAKENSTDYIFAVQNYSYTPETAYITYNKGIPSGLYEVLYWVAGYDNNISIPGPRGADILDTDLTIKDKNGEHSYLSVKDEVNARGYISAGVYDFNGNNDYIKVTVNTDNEIMSGNAAKKYFASSKIKLVPVSDSHEELLNAVNSASSAADIETAVKAYGENFLDTAALKYMGGVYEKLFDEKAEGYANAYEFKRAFDKAVKSCLTKVEYESYTSAWQVSSTADWRANALAQSLTLYGTNNNPDGHMILSFQGLKTYTPIKAAELKLTANSMQTNALLDSISGDIHAKPVNEYDNDLKNLSFTDLSEKHVLLSDSKDILSDELQNEINKNGYLHLKFSAENINYSDGNAGMNKYLPSAVLTVYYDETYNPNMSITAAAVNSSASYEAKVFDVNGFSSPEKITVNQKELNSTDYSFNGSKLLINGNIFENEGSYNVEITENGETRSTSAAICGDVVIYAADSEKAAWTGTASGGFDSSLSRPDTNNSLRKVTDLTSGAAVKYTGLPKGVYDVYTYYPVWLDTADVNYHESRSVSVSDANAEIQDKNCLYNIESTKPSIIYEGYAPVGTFEFSGDTAEYIKFSVNKNWSDITNIWVASGFYQYAVKLVPTGKSAFVKYYYDNGIDWLSQVNNADSQYELEALLNKISEYDSEFADTNALYDMSGVYAKLLENDYSSEYAFKSAFDKAVASYIEEIEIDSSLVLSTTTDDGKSISNNIIYKKNQTATVSNYNADSGINSAYASVTFEEVSNLEPQAILGAELKLNLVQYADDVHSDKYSIEKTYAADASVADGNLDGNGEPNRACKVFFDGFEKMDEAILKPAFTEIDKSAVVEAAENNAPVSFYLYAEHIINHYPSPKPTTLNSAVLKVKYDTTWSKDRISAALEVAGAETLGKARELASEYADVLGIPESEDIQRYALAIWNENITDETDIDKYFEAVNGTEISMNKNIRILTDNEYIGGVTVKNFGSEATPVKVIAAAYDVDGNLAGIDYADRSTALDAKDAYVYAFVIDTAEADTINSIKVFAWGDMISITPLTRPIIHK